MLIVLDLIDIIPIGPIYLILLGIIGHCVGLYIYVYEPEFLHYSLGPNNYKQDITGMIYHKENTGSMFPYQASLLYIPVSYDPPLYQTAVL